MLLVAYCAASRRDAVVHSLSVVALASTVVAAIRVLFNAREVARHLSEVGGVNPTVVELLLPFERHALLEVVQ